MDTPKRKGLFTHNPKQMDVIMDLEVKKHRVARGDCCRWNDLPNELLLLIFQYLPHGDLQQIRIVCKRWHYLAQLPEFLNDTKLVLNDENMTILCDYLHLDRELAQRLTIFTTLELHGLEPCEDLRFILATLGPNLNKLRLHKSPVFALLNSNLPELEELTVSQIPAVQNNFTNSSVNLSEFTKLKSLDIANNVNTSIKTDMLMNLTRHLEVKMEKLCIEMNSEHEQPLIHALQCHGPSLKHLEIILRSAPVMYASWRNVFDLMENLSTLKITGDCCLFWLKVCFENLPQKAPLRHLDLSGDLQVNNTILMFVIQKWPVTLETMELMFCNGLTDEGVHFFGILINSLRSLNLSHCSKITTNALLDGLIRKTNYKLKTLVLNDIMDAPGMCLLVQRLPNLTYLSLESCREGVTDLTLAHIFRHQTQLQHLVLDDCMRITDEGLLGYGHRPAPVHNLKGLQTLSLRGCRNISNRALTKGLKFVELRKLVLGYCHKISSMGIEELVENCPAIEDLTISSCLMIDDDSMLHIAQGLPRLKRLNVSNCINLTGKSIDYVVELCKSLKELSMCGIDSLEIQEVQNKFLQMKPKILELNL